MVWSTSRSVERSSKYWQNYGFSSQLPVLTTSLWTVSSVLGFTFCRVYQRKNGTFHWSLLSNVHGRKTAFLLKDSIFAVSTVPWRLNNQRWCQHPISIHVTTLRSRMETQMCWRKGVLGFDRLFLCVSFFFLLRIIGGIITSIASQHLIIGKKSEYFELGGVILSPLVRMN